MDVPCCVISHHEMIMTEYKMAVDNRTITGHVSELIKDNLMVGSVVCCRAGLLRCFEEASCCFNRCWPRCVCDLQSSSLWDNGLGVFIIISVEYSLQGEKENIQDTKQSINQGQALTLIMVSSDRWSLVLFTVSPLNVMCAGYQH